MVEIYPGPQKPYHLKEKDISLSTYYRIGSTNRVADQYLIAEMKRSITNQSYDELPLVELNPEDVNFRVASGYFKTTRELRIEDLETLSLIKRVEGREVPTVGGILLFGDEVRRRCFPDYKVQMGFFKGLDKSTIIDSQESTVSPLVDIEEVIKFLKKHMFHSINHKRVKKN